MIEKRSWLAQELRLRGVSRRDFVGFCATLAATLALPDEAAAQIARAIAKVEKPILVWLEFQDCAGNTEGFLRASRPSAAEVILDVLSLDYHETIMAAAGHQAEENLAQTVKNRAGAYIAIVEGSIPTGANGGYCTIGGRAAVEFVAVVSRSTAFSIASVTFPTSALARGSLARSLNASACSSACSWDCNTTGASL